LNHETPVYVATGLDLHTNYFNNTFSRQYNPPPSGGPAPPQSSINLGRESFSVYVHSNEMISAVADYRIDGGSSEMYGLISQLPADGYVKLGQFEPPYGLTLADENSLVRVPLGFSFEQTLRGVEAGFYPDAFFINAALFDDAAVPLEKIESAKGGVHFSDFTLGGSVFTRDLDLPTAQVRYGAFGWARVLPFVLLAEYDRGYDGAVLGTVNNNVNAAHVSLETDLGNDVYLRLASEYINHSITQTGVYDGFRQVVSLRCYPVRDLKFQTDFQRMDAMTGPNQNNPGYGLLADAYFFY